MINRIPAIARFVFWTSIVAVVFVASARVVYVELFLPEITMRVSFTSPQDDSTLIITSANQTWASGVVTAMPTIAGINDVTFEVPYGSGNVLRWDPAASDGIYEIREVVFTADGTPHPVDLTSAVVSAHGHEATQTLAADPQGGLTLIADADDPQLLITISEPAATTKNVLLGVVSMLSAVGAIAVSALLWQRRRFNEEAIAIGTVVWLYGLFAFYVAKLASRLPFWDDWRYLREVDSSGKMPLSIKTLLKPFNDTVAATGRLIDTVVLNATDFNFLYLQMVGVLLLGVYVVLMIILVRAVGRSVAPAVTPYAILLVGLSLVAMSYWLEPAIAYHQFLPLLFGVAILLLLRLERHTALRVMAVVMLGLVAGFTYISGAVMLLAMAVAYVITFVRGWPRKVDLARLTPGLALIPVAVFTVASQLYLVARFQGSLASSSSVAASKYPWEPEFWAFYLGIAGRAIGVQSGPVLLHLGIVLVFLVAPFTVLAMMRSRGAQYPPTEMFTLLFATTLAPLYMAAVSLGRAGMGGDRPFGNVMAAGGARFHFWWVAALIPLIWLAWMAFLDGYSRGSGRQLVTISIVLVTLAIAIPKSLTPWHYPSAFEQRDLAFDRTRSCVTTNVIQGNDAILCRHASSGDIGPQLRIAYRFDMVFVDQAGLPDQ